MNTPFMKWSALTLLVGALALESRSVYAQAAHEHKVQLLAFNDFHGQLGPGKRVGERPVGSAPVFAAYLRAAIASFEGDSLLVHAGDFVGASPPASGLLQDEPSIAFLNLLANEHCRYELRLEPRCNVVGTPGNHEFDEGLTELLRLLQGGSHARSPGFERPWRGARVPYVSANVVARATGAPILPPYVIKQLGGERVAVIGAVLDATPSLVVARGVAALRFLPEAQAINRAVERVRAQGVEAIVVTIHQGAAQPAYEGPTRSDLPPPEGEIVDIVKALSPAVDVVISGHAHAFTNTLIETGKGSPVLLTQALSAGMAFAAIELTIDGATHDVVAKQARVIVTYADQGPGLRPAADVAALVARAEVEVEEKVSTVVGYAPLALRADPSPAGESALGNLIADAQRRAVQAELALMNAGGIRTDIEPGEVTWGELFAVQPFGNYVLSLELTGAEILRLLERQWEHTPARILQTSGLTYTYRASAPLGARVLDARVNGKPLVRTARYRVAVNDFLAGGSGGFELLARGRKRKVGVLDLDALCAFIAAQGGHVSAEIEGRIERLE